MQYPPTHTVREMVLDFYQSMKVKLSWQQRSRTEHIGTFDMKATGESLNFSLTREALILNGEVMAEGWSDWPTIHQIAFLMPNPVTVWTTIDPGKFTMLIPSMAEKQI